MLSKYMALWIVLLAASPFTQPFSTANLDWLLGDAQHPTPRLPHSAVVDNVTFSATPNNAPVEIGDAASHSQRHPSLVPSTHPGATRWDSSVMTSWRRYHQALEREDTSVSPLTVLRL